MKLKHGNSLDMGNKNPHPPSWQLSNHTTEDQVIIVVALGLFLTGFGFTLSTYLSTK